MFGRKIRISNLAKVGMVIEAIALVWLVICGMRSVIVPDIVMGLFGLGMVIVFVSSILDTRK